MSTLVTVTTTALDEQKPSQPFREKRYSAVLLALGLFWRKQDVIDRMWGVPNAKALTVSNVGTPLSGLKMPQDDSKQRGNIPACKQFVMYKRIDEELNEVLNCSSHFEINVSVVY